MPPSTPHSRPRSPCRIHTTSAFNPPTCALPSPKTLATAAALSSALFLTPLPSAPPQLHISPHSLHHARPTVPHPPPAYAAESIDAEHALADEIWQLVDRYYLDPRFSGVDWSAERTLLSKARLKTHNETYAAARRSLRKLSDVYTRLLTPADMTTLRKFDVSGVGLLLTTDASGALVVATDPPDGSAAAGAGISRGDVLQAVDGVDITSTGAFAVSELMQGKDGTDMSVQFRGQQPKLLRRSFPPAEGRAALRTAVLDTSDGRMGYIRLKEFRASAREEVTVALQNVVRDGAKWVVIDLRGNGGGVFEGALEIAGLFEGDGVPVARVEGRQDATGGAATSEEVFVSRVVGGNEALVQPDVELALLIDRGSASSSEVLAGALRDQCRAALVGERSYGKGVIQGVFGLSDGGGVIITVAEYRTPDGNRIQDVGLSPDIEGKVEGISKLAKYVGIEKLDETNIGVTRQQVRDVVGSCSANHRSSS